MQNFQIFQGERKMKNSTFLIWFFVLIIVLFVLPVAGFAQERSKRPPEYDEMMKAVQMTDRETALKELQRIKEKYPDSAMMEQIDFLIASMTVSISTSLDQILEAQKTLIQSARGFSRVQRYINSGQQILNSKYIENFDLDRVLKTILYYSEEGQKHALEEIQTTSNSFNLMVAETYIRVKNGDKALDLLEKYRNNGGTSTADFYYKLGQANELQGKKKEAFDAYFEAAGSQYKDSQKKARALFKETDGNPEEMDRMLAAKLSELPFHPEPFELAEDWNGKAVLAELFTGSECPPCVAVDLSFDALLERYDSKYLIVLVYHLPIPGPDPMMNTATSRRQTFYEVRSTPQTFFDGILKFRGGGSRTAAKKKYEQYISLIDPVVSDTPQAKLTVTAVLEGDNVKVSWSSDDEFEDVFYNFALVQKEEEFLGRNGIPLHRMVVRDFKTLTKKFAMPSKDKSLNIFNVKTAEKYAEKALKEYEKQRKIKFKELHYKIDRTQLKVVFFLQDKDSSTVYNAVVCDVVME